MQDVRAKRTCESCSAVVALSSCTTGDADAEEHACRIAMPSVYSANLQHHREAAIQEAASYGAAESFTVR